MLAAATPPPSQRVSINNPPIVHICPDLDRCDGTLATDASGVFVAAEAASLQLIQYRAAIGRDSCDGRQWDGPVTEQWDGPVTALVGAAGR